MNTKLISSQSDHLLIFFTWWWCDDNQFINHYYSWDLLLCRDYSNLDFDWDFSQYKDINLLAYSAWVFVASLLKDILPNINNKIAINWNPMMFDDYFGIDKKWLNLMKNLSESNCMDFIKSFLLFDDADFENFITTPSLRSFDSSKNEAACLENFSKKRYTPMIFDKVLLSDNDNLFYPHTQQEYFKDYKIIRDAAHHTPFLKYRSLDNLINL